MGFLSSSIVNAKNLTTRYNEVASKGSRLGEGTHEVTISAVELNKENKSIKVTYKDSEDKSHVQYTWLVQRIYDRDSGQLTRDEEIATSYLQMTLGLGFTASKGVEFLIAASESPSLFQALCGLKTKIKLAVSSYGVSIVRNEAGQLYLVDAGSGKFESVLQELAAGKTFESFSDAREFVSSAGKQLKIAYLEVKAHMEVNEEVSNANREAIQTAISATASGSQSKLSSIL